jgi:flagellar L-ring protein precursor FlgH
MRKFLQQVFILLAMLLLSACVADNNAKKLVAPMEKMASIYDNGTIFKPGFNERPLFEERRARNVGDGLIMNVAEVPKKKVADKVVDPKADPEVEARNAERERRRREAEELINIANDALVGNVTMTVMEVLENGNLFVAGGRQVVVDGQDKYINVTGVVDPNNITNGNIVQSTQVSEVRIQVDDVRIRPDRTATRFSEGQSVFNGLFQSMRSE